MIKKNKEIKSWTHLNVYKVIGFLPIGIPAKEVKGLGTKHFPKELGIMFVRGSEKVIKRKS